MSPGCPESTPSTRNHYPEPPKPGRRAHRGLARPPLPPGRSPAAGPPPLRSSLSTVGVEGGRRAELPSRAQRRGGGRREGLTGRGEEAGGAEQRAAQRGQRTRELHGAGSAMRDADETPRARTPGPAGSCIRASRPGNKSGSRPRPPAHVLRPGRPPGGPGAELPDRRGKGRAEVGGARASPAARPLHPSLCRSSARVQVPLPEWTGPREKVAQGGFKK